MSVKIRKKQVTLAAMVLALGAAMGMPASRIMLISSSGVSAATSSSVRG